MCTFSQGFSGVAIRGTKLDLFLSVFVLCCRSGMIGKDLSGEFKVGPFS